MIKPLDEDQKKALKFLNDKFENAIQSRNINEAEKVTAYLQDLLKEGQEAKLMKYKAILFELYMDLGYYSNAESGFIGITKKAKENTRIHLEACAMLAICYIRKGELDNAEPLIQKVIKNEKVIKSSSKRFLFRSGIIDRFNEEGILLAVKRSNTSPSNASLEDLHTDLEFLEGYSNDELYSFLGSAMPEADISILIKLDNFSRKQLPSGERLLLSSPVSVSNKEEIGKKIFKSLKRTFYNCLCDPNSEFYKTWSKGLTRVSSGASLVDAIYSVIKGIGVNISIFISPFVALIVRFGIEWYCTHKKPLTLADLR